MITVLQSKPNVFMAKTFTPEGVKPYDNAKYVTVQEIAVDNIEELSALLNEMERSPRQCIVRGKRNGSAPAELIQGQFITRKKVLFDDVPSHLCLIDIDTFESDLPPVEAINSFIHQHLPVCFKGVSYHWQLSSSQQPMALILIPQTNIQD